MQYRERVRLHGLSGDVRRERRGPLLTLRRIVCRQCSWTAFSAASHISNGDTVGVGVGPAGVAVELATP